MAFLLKSFIKSPNFLRHALRKPQNSSSWVFLRALASSSPRFSPGSGNDQKPLSILFEEAVGLSPRSEETKMGSESNELKKKLLELESEIIELKKSEFVKKSETAKTVKSEKPKKIEKTRSLYALYTGDESKEQKSVGKDNAGSEEREEIKVFKELSPEMVTFVRLLYREGYFNKANFLPRNSVDMGYFDNAYARDFLKFAAEKFGKDHQEIAKWLSGSALKKIALFGCPTLNRKTVFSAKRLRRFFEIQEDTVCRKCVLKDKCKFPNQSVWKSDKNRLDLAIVMRVITLYGCDLVHPNLQVPDEIYASADRLLEEVLNLSRTVSSSGLNQHFTDF